MSTTPNTTKNDVILVYARIRPPASKKIHRNGTGKYDIVENEEENAKESNMSHYLHLSVPKDDRIGGYVDNTIEKYQFSFHKLFGMSSKQNDIFSEMAIPIIDNTLNGYNGTIFAYGQTGSGKTFTMTGGTASYDDRGLIPRTISYIFNKCKETKKEFNHKIEISYLEIYNNEGYDLLNDDDENNKALKDLPKVKLFEDEQGIISLSNINLLNVSNEEEALNYLFIGDTNRMICETPNNDTSSRSHCIFTIFIESQKIGSDKIRRSKLNMVDLAGSERVYKAGLNGNILTESKFINLSLHYLEQVILALHSKQNHIPYRNSMITTILKDSLGGNCKTVMIATLSMDLKSIFESVSTCRFAQRVALIKNVSSINEHIDPHLLIKKLKLQIKQLKEELMLARGGNGNDQDLGDLNEEEKERCKQMVEYFMHNEQDDDDLLFNVSDQRKIRHCFKCMKDVVIYQPPKSADKGSNNGVGKDIMAENKLKGQIKELRQTVQERDHEINVLVKMLKKHKITMEETKPKKQRKSSKKKEEKSLDVVESNNKINGIAEAGATSKDESVRRNEAFKVFVQKSDLYTIVEDNKNILKHKFAEAKNLGLMVNTTRAKMNALKTKIEQSQITRAMNKMNNMDIDEMNDADAEEEECRLREEIEMQKEAYRKHYVALKSIKVEIEHMKNNLKKNRRQIQLNFENWWNQNNKSKKHRSKAKVITGDKVADENIAEFYAMRDKILTSMK